MSRDRRGSVAIEFSLIAIPLFMLLFGVLEVGIIFFGSSILERATDDAARLIRTGQAQAQQMTQQQFHDYICSEVSLLLSCDNLQVDVEAYTDFGDIQIPNPIGPDGKLNQNLDNYQLGAAGNIVLVRTFYSWNILTPLLKPFFANLSNGQRLLSSSSAFRDEPF